MIVCGGYPEYIGGYSIEYMFQNNTCSGSPNAFSNAQYLTNIFQGRIEYELVYTLRGAKRLLSSYSMRLRKIFVLLYSELLKQELQSKSCIKSLRTNQHF